MTVAEEAADRIRCAAWVSWAPGEADLVLFNGKDGSYHTLNGSAARIWIALSQGQQPAEICAALASDHGVSVEMVAPDVADFVSQALGKGLLVAERS